MAEWIAVIIITIFAVISPGPDFVMVSRNSLSLSRRAGILTALGIGLGVLVHVSYTLLGIGVLISESPGLFNILKLIGATYLVWLGATMLFSRKTKDPVAANKKALSDLGALRLGFFNERIEPENYDLHSKPVYAGRAGGYATGNTDCLRDIRLAGSCGVVFRRQPVLWRSAYPDAGFRCTPLD